MRTPRTALGLWVALIACVIYACWCWDRIFGGGR